MGEIGRQKTIDARSITRSSRTPLTMGIIGVTVAIYFLGRALEPALVHDSVLVAEGEWWRMFTAALLHSRNSFTHILFNMWALYVLGPQIERAVGAAPFFTLYLAGAGMGGAFAQFLTPGEFLAIGASGAVFALFGVWLNLAIRRRNTAYGRALLSQLGFLLLINAALPFIFPAISWQAHLGGFITGFVIGELWARVSGTRSEQMRAAYALVFVIAAILAVTLV